ncbi:MAG: hemolysin III family protein [Clostridia bacterium]|nr:hemolysin III family protein [Clostridia bacterium]
MKRVKLCDRVLPTYTRGEEIFNFTSHIVGGTLGIVATVLCIIFASIHGDAYAIVSAVVYGVSMTLLYTMSSIYHGLKTDTTSKKVFQIIDHCTIFILIAGSYTPFTLCTFREYNPALGWTLFGVIWFLAILGVVLNSIDLKRYRIFSMICYIAMGWCVIIKGNVLPDLLTWPGFILLVSGGIAYTVGTIFYGLGKKYKYMHSVFHIFIVLGSLLQFFCILLYVM